MNILVKLFKGSYEELWKAVIRPYRDDYSPKDLGPRKFSLNNNYYKRTDFGLINNRNIKLKCSHWEPYEEERLYNRLPCVIYLHGNSSSRCEVLPNLKYLLPLGVTVFSFDFAGCGKSDGDYISLGWYETLDLQCVISFLRKEKRVSTIGIWGRSMGAVTAIMAASRDPTIGGLFLDSPFSSLNCLIDELSHDKVILPNFLVKKVVTMIKETVREKANFNIDDIEPEKYAKKCYVPAFFCHGKDDNFVKVHHCKDLYSIYPGEKELVIVDGEHNDIRPNKLNERASEFFYNALKCRNIKEINDYYLGNKILLKDLISFKSETPMDNTSHHNNKIEDKNVVHKNNGVSEKVNNQNNKNDEKNSQKYNQSKLKGDLKYNDYTYSNKIYLSKNGENLFKSFDSSKNDSYNNNTSPSRRKIQILFNSYFKYENNPKKNELIEIKKNKNNETDLKKKLFYDKIEESNIIPDYQNKKPEENLIYNDISLNINNINSFNNEYLDQSYTINKGYEIENNNIYISENGLNNSIINENLYQPTYDELPNLFNNNYESQNVFLLNNINYI